MKQNEKLELLIEKTPKKWHFGLGDAPLYKYNGTNEEFVKDAESLPLNANFMTTNGMWKLEKDYKPLIKTKPGKNQSKTPKTSPILAQEQKEEK